MTKDSIKELSVQISLNGLSFCILNRSSDTIEYLNTINFNTKLSPYDVLSRLKVELSANAVFSDTFNEVIVIHQNELVSLVPQALFNENNKADYLKFNCKILKTDFISQDNIDVNQSINVYIPYININNYIYETFGEFIYKHSSSLLIDSVLQSNKTTNKAKVFINVYQKSIEILVLDKGKLQLSNIFDFGTKEDFIYYILFVFEQLQLDVETVPVELSGYINKDDELYNIIYTYIRHVDFIEANYKYKFVDGLQDKNLSHHYLILNSF